MLSPGRGLFRIERFGLLGYYFIYTHCPDLIATCSLTCAEIKCAAEVIQKIPISSSGSAAVTERNLLRTSFYFGPLYNFFLGLVLSYIMPHLLSEASFLAGFNFYRICVSPGGSLPAWRCPPALWLIDSLIRQAIRCLIIFSINVSNGPAHPHLRQLISELAAFLVNRRDRILKVR